MAFLLWGLPCFHALGYQLRGTVSDPSSHAIPGVTVYLKNSTYGVVTNATGEYFLELEAGKHTVVFEGLGFVTREVVVAMSDADRELHVVLETDTRELNTVVVTADQNPADLIMQKAIAAKGRYFSQFETSKCTTYVKAGLEVEKEREVIDSNSFGVKTEKYQREMELTESLSEVYFKAPNTYKEVKIAWENYANVKRPEVNKSAELNLTFNPFQKNYEPPELETERQLFYTNVSDADFNFYQNRMSISELCERPLLSPLANSAFIDYRFELLESFKEDGLLVHKIRVLPKRSSGPLFNGMLYVVDSLWCLKAVELEVNQKSLVTYSSFRLFINYQRIESNYWVAQREEFFYTYKDADEFIIGHSNAVHSKYEINPNFTPSPFNGALSETSYEATTKGLEFWNEIRPVTLKPSEIAFAQSRDSLKRLFNSYDFLLDADAEYNRNTVWDALIFGLGHRNSSKGTNCYFNPLILQPRFFAVGGYRHALGGRFDKTDKTNGKGYGVEGEVSFGLRNTDMRGEADLYHRFNPKKMSRVTFGGGSSYELINRYESIATTFSRSNYLLSEYLRMGYETEFVNGLKGSFNVSYSDDKSLDDYQLANWSNSIFPNNTPRAFDQYRKLVFESTIEIRFKQQYYMKPTRKVVLGSKYPKLLLTHTLGVPRLLGSDVSFQYLELQVYDDMRIGALGISKYNIEMGSFLYAEGIQYADNRLFRTSDISWFSNPLYSFQLLRTSVATREPFIQAHYVHQFNGALTDKIPLVNRMKLRTSVGASVFHERSNDIFHMEYFAGVQHTFRAFRSKMGLGIYYTQSATPSNGLGPTSAWKIGLQMYDPFTNSWNY